jgi:putative oxidoreductase
MNSDSFFRRAYRLLVLCASYLQSPVLLIIRVFWGWQFVQTGWGKFFAKGIPAVAEYFQSLNIPMPMVSATLAATTELVGGFCLLIGLASRLACIPLIFTMIIAYVTTEQEALGALFSDPDKALSATPFLFLYAAVIVLVFGPGAFSIDWFLKRHFAPTEPRDYL